MRTSSFSGLALGALVLAAGGPVSADSFQFQSGTKRVSLLELYTSEGCSSCPPAEAWISRLKESPRLWQEFVPVAFHVDYWDYLGWKDPYASRAFSERQRHHAERWASRSVYTPGFVLDGTEWKTGSARDTLPPVAGKPAGTLMARSGDGRQWTTRFQPTPGHGQPSYDFHAALLGFDLSSNVKAGENRGRKLEHDFVALAFASASAIQNGDAAQATLTLKPTPASAGKPLALAVWVTPSRSLLPIQAVGGWLTSTNRMP